MTLAPEIRSRIWEYARKDDALARSLDSKIKEFLVKPALSGSLRWEYAKPSDAIGRCVRLLNSRIGRLIFILCIVGAVAMGQFSVAEQWQIGLNIYSPSRAREAQAQACGTMDSHLLAVSGVSSCLQRS
jgi:hypothetical protein